MAIIVRYKWDSLFFIRHEMRLKNKLIIANYRNKLPAGLPPLSDIASNPTTYDIFLTIDRISAYYVEILTMLIGAVCRERHELWERGCSYVVTVFEFTELSVSSSLWGNIAQQSIAVLHTTLFSRQCHCSTISVATAITHVHFSQPSLQYNLYNQCNNTQLLNPSLCCNSTAICAVSHLPNCTTPLWLFQNFFTVRPTV